MNYPAQQKMEAKENNGNCMLNALLEDMFILRVGVVSAYTRSSWPAALTLCVISLAVLMTVFEL